jgi:hypothetical protein
MRVEHWLAAAHRQLARADASAAHAWALGRLSDEVLAHDLSAVTAEEHAAVWDAYAAGEDLSDHIYFLLMTLHHALVVAPRRLTEAGVAGVPSPATREDVELLRNIAEHWDAPQRLAWVAGEQPDPPWVDKRLGAGRRFAQKHTNGFPSSHAYSQQGLSEVGGVLKMTDVRRDLGTLADFVREHDEPAP